MAILHGLGGVGKTQLAIRFVQDHRNDFSAIFWLNGKDQGTLLQSLSSSFSLLPGQSQNTEAINNEEVEQRAKDLLLWLALEGNSRWLIVLDNIDQYDTHDLVQFFPTADHGSILITSRLQQMTELGESFPIHKLDFKDAIQLLIQSSRLSHVMKNTAQELESHPGTK